MHVLLSQISMNIRLTDLDLSARNSCGYIDCVHTCNCSQKIIVLLHAKFIDVLFVIPMPVFWKGIISSLE